MDQGKPLKVGKSQIGNFMEANVLMGWSTRRVEIYPSSPKNHQFFYGDTETETSENKIAENICTANREHTCFT